MMLSTVALYFGTMLHFLLSLFSLEQTEFIDEWQQLWIVEAIRFPIPLEYKLWEQKLGHKKIGAQIARDGIPKLNAGKSLYQVDSHVHVNLISSRARRCGA